MVIGAPISGRWSVLTAAPDWEMSMTLQVTLIPFCRMSRAAGLRGVMRPWRRSSGKPSELGGELVALARSGRDGHGKAVLELARDDAFEPTDMVDIGNDAFGRFSAHGRDQGHPARRHVDDLAGIFTTIRQHVAPEQIHPDPLKSPAFFAERQKQGFFQRKRHKPDLLQGMIGSPSLFGLC